MTFSWPFHGIFMGFKFNRGLMVRFNGLYWGNMQENVENPWFGKHHTYVSLDPIGYIVI
jgi:hypothetical protein